MKNNMQTFPIKSLNTFTQLALSTCISSMGLMIASNLPAQALLFGDEVRGQFGITGDTPFLDTTSTVVDPGTEFIFTSGDGSLSLDVKNDSFDIIYNLGTFAGVGKETTWILSDLDLVGTPGIITGVTLTSGNRNFISGTSFTDDSITVNLANFSSPPIVQTWTFDLTTSHTSVPFESNTFIPFGFNASVPFEFSPSLGLVIVVLGFGGFKYLKYLCPKRS